MSRFFKTNGDTISNMIRNLAPNESIVVELATNEGFDKPMRTITSLIVPMGIKVEQSAIKAVEHKPTSDVVVRLIRITRVE